MSWDDEERHAARVERRLLAAGLVRVVDPTSDEETSGWTACDLASVVEGCFHVRIEPFALDDGERQRWLDRLGDSYEVPDPALDRAFLRYLWLVDGGAPIGTIALPVSSLGRTELPVWSLYVHPERRGRGIAARALRIAHETAREVGLRDGVVLDTHWVWQRSVRFYLGLGMWVVGWKRSLTFRWVDALGPHQILESPDRITLAVEERGALRPWLEATRSGDALALYEHEALPERGRREAHATLAVALATRGWPLVRSPEHWARRHASMDVGEVEGLAAKIAIFEATAREHGWDVRTPSVGGAR